MSNIKDKVVLLRLGEIALKGLNRRKFEEQLIQNLARPLRHYFRYEVLKRDGRIYIEPIYKNEDKYTDDEMQDNLENAIKIAKNTFGIVSLSPVSKIDYDDGLMIKEVLQIAKQQKSNSNGKQFSGKKTFKVEVKRSKKSYPLNSMELAAKLGEIILEENSDLTVDVHNPDFTVWVELRDKIYIYSEVIKCHRGLPVGVSSKAMVLLSGGIDSPVASYMIASRGCPLEAIYFHTFPYTSDRAKEKVFDLAKIVSQYSGLIRLHVVDFTDCQLELNDKVPEELMTVVMRRMMMRVAEQKAIQNDCQALVTGESLGQVASQTMEAIYSTDKVVEMPIFRPLIGLDKEDTIKIARDIDTFETSILPYDDCCTVFVAKHPNTRPRLEKVEQAEMKLDINDLINQCLGKIESFDIRPWGVFSRK